MILVLVLVLVLILVLLLLLHRTLLVYYTLGKHIVILRLLIGGVEAQRLPEGVQRRLILLLRKEALTEVAIYLRTLHIRKQCVGCNLLIQSIRGLVS